MWASNNLRNSFWLEERKKAVAVQKLFLSQELWPNEFKLIGILFFSFHRKVNDMSLVLTENSEEDAISFFFGLAYVCFFNLLTQSAYLHVTQETISSTAVGVSE